MGKIYFITGIDTGVGKSVVTGWLAKEYMKKKYSVITQKFIQTGNKNISEDIVMHRKIMGLPLLDIDMDGTTCPYILSYPASPHLASSIDEVKVNVEKIKECSRKLSNMYDIVLIEGAGGLMVPISDCYLTVDYIRDNNLPVIIVTSPKLGSLNHTLMTIDVCKKHDILIDRIIYNRFGEYDSLIADNSFLFIKNYMKNYNMDCEMAELSDIRL